MNEYGSYNQSLMYDTVARSSLRIKLYDMWSTIESEIMYIESGLNKFRSTPLYDHYEESRKAQFFINAACMCYIPYNKAGYEYLQNMLGDTPLWEYRYTNIINKLEVIGIVLSKEDKEGLEYLLKSYEGNEFRLDAYGLAALLLRVRGYVEGETGKLHRGYNTLILAKAFDRIVLKISNKVKEEGLSHIDITEFLTEKEELTLYQNEIDYMEELFFDQSFPRVHIKSTGIDQLGVIDKNRNLHHTVSGVEKAKCGDYLLLRYNNFQARGKITGVNGDIVTFKVEEMESINLPFIEYLTKEEMDVIEKQDMFYLLRRDSFMYRCTAFAEFELREEKGERVIRADVCASQKSFFSEELLKKEIGEDAVAVPPTSAFTKEDYNNYVCAIKLKVKK